MPQEKRLHNEEVVDNSDAAKKVKHSESGKIKNFSKRDHKHT